MMFKHSKQEILTRIFAPLAVFVLPLIFVATCYAITEAQLEKYSQSGIIFYDPGDEVNKNFCNSYNGGEVTNAQLDATSSNDERLRLVTETYGELAMLLQEEYGLPWELVFAQMLHESAVGSTGVAASIKAATGRYNFLGMTCTTGPGLYATSCYQSTNHNFNVYDSISVMIAAWSTSYGRNGYYNAAFAYLDPKSYNLESFVNTFLNVYAPTSDGNDVNGYTSAVMASINGTIHDVAKKKGWLTSEELAKSKNIPVGGRWPIDGKKGILTDIKNKYGENQIPLPSLSSQCTPTSTHIEVVEPIYPLNQDSDNIACPKETIDLGVYDQAHFQGNQIKIRLCALPNLHSDADESKRGNKWYIEGADNYAIVSSRVAGAFYAMVQDIKLNYGWDISVSSAFRTLEKQQYFYDCYKEGQKVKDKSTVCNHGNYAAAPTTSRHESGYAIDLNVDKITSDQQVIDQNYNCASTNASMSQLTDSNAKVNRWFGEQSKILCDVLGKYKLKRNVKNEVWHVDPEG